MLLMKVSKKFLIFISLLAMLTSCTTSDQQKQDDGSEALYAEAEQCYTNGNYSRGKILIDSIHTKYRRNVELRKRASALMTEITSAEHERNRHYADSIRPIRQAEFDALIKNFRVSSDSAYLSYKKYIHKNQRASSPRISLVAEVKEDGEIHLISVYMGKKLNHQKVKVSTKDNFFVETESISLDSPYNNQFDDFGTRWEYLTFTKATMGDLPTFIADNADKPLKVTLISEKSSYSYNLAPSDRAAIKQAVELSAIEKDIIELDRILK